MNYINITSYITMEVLQSVIKEEVFDCLIKANITSLDLLLMSDEAFLQDATSLSAKDTRMVIEEASKLILGHHFVTANEVPSWKRISTGCHKIDSITRGGIPVNGITEIVGCSGVGKTQLCLQLCMMAQLNQETDPGVIYICTEDVFPVKRCVQLADIYRQKYHSAVRFEDNIFIQHLADYEQIRKCLYTRIPELLRCRNIALIVIDSIAGIFRSENNEASYASRSQDFLTLVSKFLSICDENTTAIVCVNQVSENIEDGRTEPCLGLAWSNMITSRFNITRHNGSSTRDFEIVFAPDLADKCCSFKICEDGLVDA